MQDLDFSILDTVVGGGVLGTLASEGAGGLTAVSAQYFAMPAWRYLAVAGGIAGAGYGAYTGAQEGYARHGVPGAAVVGVVRAVKYGAAGVLGGVVAPGVVAGTIVRNGVARALK